MAFDAAKFERTKLEPRRGRVAVPALAPFFDDDEEPIWEVRGLTASELYRAMEAQARQSSRDTLIRAAVAEQKGEQVKALRDAFGLGDATPAELAKRLEMLVSGSVSPTIDLTLAVKLATNYAIEFTMLTNTISELTGKGADLAKPEAASQPTQD